MMSISENSKRLIALKSVIEKSEYLLLRLQALPCKVTPKPAHETSLFGFILLALTLLVLGLYWLLRTLLILILFFDETLLLVIGSA